MLVTDSPFAGIATALPAARCSPLQQGWQDTVTSIRDQHPRDRNLHAKLLCPVIPSRVVISATLLAFIRYTLGSDYAFILSRGAPHLVSTAPMKVATALPRVRVFTVTVVFNHLRYRRGRPGKNLLSCRINQAYSIYTHHRLMPKLNPAPVVKFFRFIVKLQIVLQPLFISCPPFLFGRCRTISSLFGLGARGRVIVGTHRLVSRGSSRPLPLDASYGIRFSAFPVSPSFKSARFKCFTEAYMPWRV